MLRFLTILALVPFLSLQETNPGIAFPKIENNLSLIWKIKTGAASFRSNAITRPGQLIIGSNGSAFMDYNLIDKLSGVYLINSRNGSLQKRVGHELLGDMDVNGIVLYKGRLFFGNDNEEFLCTDLNGKQIWRNPTSGDIEHEPVLLKTPEKTAIVYASEAGEVKAVDPDTGNPIWSYYLPDFNGWKPGMNRSIFKVKAYFSNTQSFYTKPLVYDCNRDGYMDLVYLTFDQKLICLNGKNGKLLWSKTDIHGISCSPLLHRSGGVDYILCTGGEYKDNSTWINFVCFIRPDGQTDRIIPLNSNEYSMSLNEIKLTNGSLLLADNKNIIELDNNGNITTWEHSLYVINKYFDGKEVKETRGVRDPLFGDSIFSYRGNEHCIVLLSQHDSAQWEKGFIEIISLDTKEVIERFQLPAASEFPPLIKDINGDGKLDLLVNCYDDYTYCYQLK